MTERRITRRIGLRVTAFSMTFALLVAAAALALPRVTYSGQTSQQRPISFIRAGSQITRLKYRIDDRCPGGKPLFVNAWGFPALQIRHAKFGGRFVGNTPQKATAVVRGRVSGSTISGTISDQRINSKTHKLCSGQAAFALTHEPRRRGSDG